MTMRRVLLAGAAVLVALILVTGVAVYVRDGRTMRRAGEAVLRINQFCSNEGRLPDTGQLADLFPDLSPGAGWYYWPSTDRRQATLQYPMAARRSQAPGSPRISEFTATTYAYQVPLACASPPSRDLVEDPYRAAWKDEGSLDGLVRFFLDLDHDGLPDLFVGAKALLGPGGGPFRVYRRSGVGWLPIGEVFVHPGAIELLPSRHGGFVDLRYCGQVSVDACSLVTYVFSETAYGPSASPRVVSEGDLGARSFARTEPEESGPRLTWR